MPLSTNPALKWVELPWCAKVQAARLMFGVDDPRTLRVEQAAPAAVQQVLRSAVGEATTGNFGVSGPTAGAVAAFVTALQTKSFFARFLADAAVVRVPLNRRIGFVTTDASAWLVGQGKPKPVGGLVLANNVLEPVKAVAMLVASEELIANVGPSAESTFNRALQGAVARVIDATVLSALLDDESDVPTLTATSDVWQDLRDMLDLLTPNSGGLYFVASRSTANRLATLGGDAGQTFAAATPNGGELLGLPLLVSDAVGVDEMVLIDGGALAAEMDTIGIRVSREASVEMADDGNLHMDATTGAATAASVSLFQTNSVAILAECSFGVSPIRNAIVQITDCSWGESTT
jgi:HK97 family phage major capsid protein